MNILQEAARRVTLTDLVEDVKEGNKFFEDLDRPVRRIFQAGMYFRTGMRGTLRFLGDYILISGVHAAYQDQQNGLTQAALSAGICGFAYLMDYIGFERLSPAPWKKDDSQ